MQDIRDITFNVSGMTCGSCVPHVTDAVRALLGVIDVEVKLKAGTVLVDYDPAMVNPEDINRAIQDAGYDVEGDTPASIRPTPL